MCNKEETKKIMQELSPRWAKSLGMAMVAIITALTGMNLSVSSTQGERLTEFDIKQADRIEKLSDSFREDSIQLKNSMDIVKIEMENLKEITLSRIATRSVLVDERCSAIKTRLEKIEKEMDDRKDT